MLFTTLKIVVEFAVTLQGCMAMGMLFDRMHWPLFHSWALMHGSFALLFPIMFSVVHLIGKSLESVFKPSNASTLPITSYISSNWKTFVALFLGFIGFMIPCISIGGLILGLRVRSKRLMAVDTGLLTVSIVVSSLGTAFALYMIWVIVYIALMPRS